MKQFTHYLDLDHSTTTAVAIGNFDGVHRGHQALLTSVKSSARIHNIQSAVLTFEPHPVRILAPHIGVERITAPIERLALFKHHGIEIALEQKVDKAFAQLTPVEFVEKVLVQGLKAKSVVVGYDFGFGAKRAGTIATLEALGKKHGFTIDVITPQVDEDGDVISSSRIRRLLDTGCMEDAARLLGRPFHVHGEVIQGDQRGRTIGFPTANVVWEQDIKLSTGVYSGWLDIGNGPLAAVINLGHQPTFGAQRSLALEVHALESKLPELYGRNVRVWFHTKIRDEQKFDGVDALIEQVRKDARTTKRTLSDQRLPPHYHDFAFRSARASNRP